MKDALKAALAAASSNARVHARRAFWAFHQHWPDHGDEIFERFHRAHQNTLEQLVIFIPAVCAAGYFASPLLAVACGLAFLVGRAWYFRCYIVDPDTRGPGMVITSLSSLILLTSALVGAIRSLLS